MSSILVGDLLHILKNYPEDYEVIFEIRERVDDDIKKSIAYINGIKPNHDYHEVRLMN